MKRADVGLVEAILFAAGDSVNIDDLCRWTGLPRYEIDNILLRLEDTSRATIARRFDDRVQLVTNPEYSDALQAIFNPEPVGKLSASLMETLTIVAYCQPVTRIEVEELRGVQCSYSIAALCSRGLIERKGTRAVLGHPAEYVTTEEFLRQFDLRSLDDLPPVGGLDNDSPTLDV